MNPILLAIPQLIPTKRLILRTPQPGDGPMVSESVRDTIEELKPWMPWATDAYGPEDGELWCRRSAGDFHLRKSLQYVLLLREDDRIHVGNAGIFAFNWDVPRCEIGYWLRKKCTGKGYM